MRGVRIFSSCLLLQLLLLQLQHLMLHAAGADGSDQPGSGTGASSSLEREGEAAGTGGDTEIIDGSSLSSELGRPTLLELMRAARLERTLLNKPKGKAAGFASLFDTTKLMAVFVTVAVLLYAVRVRTRRYTADELTLKMSRQARWFKPRFAAYTATDGHIYVVTLGFRGLERVVLPKRYSQQVCTLAPGIAVVKVLFVHARRLLPQEKENLIGLFERALRHFESVPPDETSGYLIENWSPSEKIPPIDIRIWGPPILAPQVAVLSPPEETMETFLTLDIFALVPSTQRAQLATARAPASNRARPS
ncbi:hypothetical protein, conserved [Eimeria maxima]|uniref:Transmembrane protein n=1 Tax=Eimeria maxima TaxID=5804 RepID=U6MFL0_EIMMA|nr:hypothetical protein, conserved [Eimeria maxima]CDJ61838.1 hypothetical protein, conserved [Eimeria maxima]